jgi:hypothetical protein
MVIVLVKVAPTQFPELGVIVYVAVAAADEVLTNVWLISGCPTVCAEEPIIAPIGLSIGADQVYNVPAGTISGEAVTGLIVNVALLQMV